MELDIAREKRFGPQDVGPAGQRPVGESDVESRHHFVDLAGNGVLVGGAKRRVGTGADPMTAEVNDRGPGYRREDVGVDP